MLNALLLSFAVISQSVVPAIVPWPRDVHIRTGTLQVTARIVVGDKSLLPLARVLAGEMRLACGVVPQVAEGVGKKGDVILRLSPALKDETYELVVGDQAVVTGGDYHSVAMGTATLLQALSHEKGRLVVPKMQISDRPHAPYRGMMVDVARQWHPVEALYRWIELCRLFKVRYLHLHLTDDHGWTFPSTAFPKLGSRNEGAHGGLAPRVYTLQELRDLVRFADERGVTIVPEIEGPGHSGAVRLAIPDLLDSPKEPGGEAWLALLNMASEGMYSAMDTIVGEVAKVFKSSPYIHIGCDEVWIQRAELAKEYPEFIKAHGIKDSYDLFAYYCARMAAIVKRHGKKALAWEGFAGGRCDPKDVLIMAWQGDSHAATGLAAAGYSILNVPWKYNGSPPDVQYGKDMYDVNDTKLKATDPVLGGQLVAWEGTPDMFDRMRPLLPARTETFWNAPPTRPYADYASRWAAVDKLLSTLIEPIRFEASGAWTRPATPDEEFQHGNPPVFSKAISVGMSAAVPGARVRYTLDGSKPGPSSPAYRSPIRVDRTTTIRAALFDGHGRVGIEQWQTYRWVNYEKNLATGKPVTASGAYPGLGPENAVDGYAEMDRYWDPSPGVAPQWLQVDLQAEHLLGSVRLFTYWLDGRYYQYKVDLSIDGQAWTTVADKSGITKPATADGDLMTFTPTKARYVRVTMLKNSANPGLHISELRVYEEP